MSLLIGFIFLVLGAISIVNPKAAWEIRTFIGRKLFAMSYKPSPKTFNRFKVLGLFYMIIGLLIIVSAPQTAVKEPPVNEVMVPAGTATLTGEVICLPHKDTSGPHTLECAFGLRTTDGLNFALDYGADYEKIPQTGETVTVTGHVTPVQALSTLHWQKYDIVGIISVQE